MPETEPSVIFDTDFYGNLILAAFAATTAMIGVLVGAWITGHLAKRERQRVCLRDLQKDFFAGSLLAARLRAEHLLAYRKAEFAGCNFEDLYKGKLSLEEYADVAAVLNLFRLLNAFKESGHIDEADAREEFGWAYEWWWVRAIKPYSAGLENDPSWGPHLARHDWLLAPRKSRAR